ncbi:MAG: hypothetical protein ILP09_06805 [Oscillospiraceae bacterium]|nr:hypothetical protein [Oscillospiraceae bacterium]
MTLGQMIITAAAFAAGCAAACANFAVTRRMLEKNVNNLTRLYFVHTLTILVLAAAVGAAAWALKQNILRCVIAAVLGATVLQIVLAAAAKNRKR